MRTPIKATAREPTSRPDTYERLPLAAASAVVIRSRSIQKSHSLPTPEVDRGIDLTAFREVGDRGIQALPLQLKCASTASFSLDRKYAGRGIVLAYVWNVLSPLPSG